MTALEGYYTTADVARMRGTHRVAAHRWLLRNIGKHGRFIGRLRVWPKEAYKRAALAEHIDDKFAKVEGRLGDVEDDVQDHGRRMTAIVQRVARLESLMAS